MWRRAAVAVVCGMAVTLSWVSPALAAGSTPGAGATKQVSQRIVRAKMPTLPVPRRVRKSSGAAASPLDVPPAGGCQPYIGGDLIEYYDNGILASVVVTYNTQVVCTATGSGQSMAALTTTAGLWKDAVQVDTAPLEPCSNCLETPISGTTWVCDTGVSCAGTYWVSNFYLMALPDGYEWLAAPPSCIGGPGVNPPYTYAGCSAVSATLTVPPTM